MKIFPIALPDAQETIVRDVLEAHYGFPWLVGDAMDSRDTYDAASFDEWMRRNWRWILNIESPPQGEDVEEWLLARPLAWRRWVWMCWNLKRVLRRPISQYRKHQQGVNVAPLPEWESD